MVILFVLVVTSFLCGFMVFVFGGAFEAATNERHKVTSLLLGVMFVLLTMITAVMGASLS